MLWLGLTLPAILALYILRRRRRERRVSSTLFWRQVTAELSANRPWRRLQSRLLLWLQLLAAALVTLAAAGPVWQYGRAPGEMIVLLDASASMRATDVSPNRFQAACRAIEAEAAGLKPGTTMTVIAFERQPRVVVQRATDAAAVRQALAGLEPGTAAADPGPALSLAGALAREGDAVRFLLVSDGGLTIPEGAPPLEFLLIGREASNIALTGLTLRPLPGGQAAQVAVKNFGSRPVSGQVRLTAAAKPAGSRSFYLEPGATEYLLWEQLPAGVPVQAELLPDDPADNLLALDDVARAVPETSREARILLVTEGNMFLERVFGLIPGLDVYRVTPATYRQLLETAYPYELTVLDGVAPEPLPPGGVLLINPPEGSSFQGVEAGPAYRPGELRAVPGSAFLRYIDLAEVYLGRARNIKLATGWQADILAGGIPLVAHRESGNRRLALLAFDLHASDLPLRPAFPVLMQNMISWLLPPLLVAPEEAVTGSEVKVAALPLAEKIVVAGPDGYQEVLAPPFPPAPFVPEVPGFYQLVESWGHQDDRTEVKVAALFAVNGYRATEADLTPRDPMINGRDGDVSRVLSRVTLAPSWSLSGPVTLLVLLLVLVEWGVACRGY